MKERKYQGWRSPTQKPLSAISVNVLDKRAEGITSTRKAIKDSVGNKELVQDLIASMNYSVSQVVKELRSRKPNKKKR